MDEKLAILLKHLPALQAQGVYSIKIDGIEVHLRGMPQAETSPPQELPAGRDPVTYGLPPGVKMPSLRDRRDQR
jgi:hypothetical protein